MTVSTGTTAWVDHRIYCDPAGMDPLIVGKLAPLLDELSPDWRLRQLFREWQGGPNVRVSLLVEHERLTDVASTFHRAVADHLAGSRGEPLGIAGGEPPLDLAAREATTHLAPQANNSVIRVEHTRRSAVLGGDAAAELYDRFHAISTEAVLDTLRSARQLASERMQIAIVSMLAVALRFPGPLRLGGMSFRSHVEGAVMESPAPDRLRTELDRIATRWAPRLASLVEPILAGSRAPRDFGLPGLARFLDAVDELVPDVRLLLHTDRLRLPMAGPGGETEWADSVLAKSQFHLELQRDPRWTVAASTDPVLRVHRVLVNWTYLHMTRLGIAPAQRLALCRIVADIVDRNPDVAHWLTAGAADIARRDGPGTTALRYARGNRTGSTIPTSVDWSRLPAERVEPDRHLVTLPVQPFPEPSALPMCSPVGWGFFLQHTGGVSRVRFEAGIACGAQRFLGPVHRVVASAGRRYPGEVHALLGDAVPGARVGRYEPLYHALAVPANPPATTETAPPAAAVVITPWRTRFKYGEFAYRLQCMDAGVLVGQALEVGRAISWDLEVCYYFLDAEVDRLLGIDGVRSRTYALLGNGYRPGAPTYRSGNGQETLDTAIDQNVDRVARANSGRPYLEIAPLLPRLEAGAKRWVDLPDTSDTVPDWTQRRSSLGFVDRKPVDVARFAGVLRRMCRPYRSDVPGGRAFAQTALIAAIGDVSDLAPGVYLVADDGRRLGLLREGDVRPDLQRATTRAVFGIERMPVVLTLLGDYEAALPAYGDRWLRVQGMEAGIAVQRAHLAGEANSLACQAHCGFDPDQLLSILGVADQHLDPLIQLLIGWPKSAGLAYELAAL